jgi:hypothetical protein
MRKREFFRIEKFRRRYDRKAGKFVFNIAYKTAVEMSPRTVAVAEAFGLGIDEQKEFVIYDNVELKIACARESQLGKTCTSNKSLWLAAANESLLILEETKYWLGVIFVL